MAKTIDLRPVLLAALVACGGTSKEVADPTGPPLPEVNPPREVDMPGETITGSSKYPPAPRENASDELHGVTVPDPYRWLEDPKREDTQKWLDANDSMTRKILAEIPQREHLTQRFKDLFYIDYVSAPAKRGKRYFYTRRHKDKEKSIVYWKQGKDGEEKVLLDPNSMSDDGHISLGGWYPTYDGKTVAYKLKENNADESVMYLRDVATGKVSEVDVLEGVKYSGASWTPKGDGFYYTYLPTDPSIPVAERPGHAEVRFHRVGTDPKQDEIVFWRTGTAQSFIGGGVSRDGRWLLVYVQFGWNAADVYFKDLRKKPRKPRNDADVVDLPGGDKVPAAVERTVREKVRDQALAGGFEILTYGTEAKYDVSVWKNTFYVHTDDGAPKYRVFKVNPKKPARDNWTEIVAESDTPIESVSIVGNHLVLHYLRNAYTEIEVRKLSGKLVRRVELPGIGNAGLGGEPDDDEAYFSFTSFTEPVAIYKTSIKKGKPELWARVEVPADMSDVEVKQTWYQSKDGTKVPMFIVHKNGIALDGNNPTLLYGYGGFNVSLQPSFSSAAVAWLEHGGVYAMPNLRGGGEFGEEWHRAGMLLNKQNVFDDFIAAAEFLIREGYTSRDKLAIWGGSNGGLLVGAAMTQRPELFRAVVCAVPLLDMVRFHKFGSGMTWVPEYGSAEDPEQFKVLHGYSPYHRVKRDVDYPALLMMAADNDDRVDPMHARKFTAAVQWASNGDRPHLVRVEKNAGHGGADLIKANVEKYADQFSFLMWQLGMK
jgi:prolyl oligopeptidase